MTQKIPAEQLHPTWSEGQRKKHREVQDYTLIWTMMSYLIRS